MRSYLSDVWKRVWSMWKPVLSAANQVRSCFMPPNGRTATCPSDSRLHGQPQCSSLSNSLGASATKASTAAWSHSQSPPEMVSWACSSRLSPARMTPAAPPSAETVWLRIGYTFETTATLSRASASATAIAARNPAPPPPITRTSCAGPASPAMIRARLSLNRLAVVPDRPYLGAAVVVLMADPAAAAVVVLVADDQALIVLVLVVIASHDLAAGRQFGVEADLCANHRSLPLADGRRFTGGRPATGRSR